MICGLLCIAYGSQLLFLLLLLYADIDVCVGYDIDGRVRL